MVADDGIADSVVASVGIVVLVVVVAGMKKKEVQNLKRLKEEKEQDSQRWKPPSFYFPRQGQRLSETLEWLVGTGWEQAGEKI